MLHGSNHIVLSVRKPNISDRFYRCSGSQALATERRHFFVLPTWPIWAGEAD